MEMNAPAIQQAIGAALPDGSSTPTAAAIRVATSYLKTLTDPNPEYILLATDGAPRCGACPPPEMFENDMCCLTTTAADGTTTKTCRYSGEPESVDAISDALRAGIPTYVIGIGTQTAEEQVLNQMARSGGKARPESIAYYPAHSQDEVASVVEKITSGITTCTKQLSRVPPSIDHVFVSADGQSVPRDPSRTEGWSFGPDNKTIHLHGSFCQRLQAGALNELRATFGCPAID
jgi:hypothetical protein